MTLLTQLTNVEEAKQQLEGIAKPFRQELNRRQKKADFIKSCLRCLEKDDFFQLDELLKSRLMGEVLEEAALDGCTSIFSQLQAYADEQLEQYKTEFKSGLMEVAEQVGLPMQVDFPRFFVMKGIEGEVNSKITRFSPP